MEAYLKATGADKFAKAFGNASKDVQGLEKSSSRANITVGSLLKTIAGTAAVVGAIRMVTSSLDGAISRVDTLNSFPRVLQMMGFDAADSEEAISKLSDGIDGLPTTLDSVASTTQRLATMTGDLDGAVDTTLALNNAFLASGASAGDAQRGLEQYVQMLSTGTVDMQSWRSLQETMPIALNRTAEAFGFAGKSAQNDLYEALKEGEITFDDFNSKIIELSNETGGFAEMARESSTGIRTSWQNMRTAVVKGLADMINTIDDALGSFGGISGIFDSMKAGIQTTFSWINANIPVAINLFKEVYDTIKPWLPLIASVFTAFVTFNTVVGIVNGVKNAVAGLRAGMILLNATMLANPIALVIAVLAGLAVMFVYLWNTSETFRQKVTEVFQTFLDFVMPIVQTVVDFVMELWGMLVSWWQANNAQILSTAQSIWSSVVSVIMTVVDAVVSFVMDIWAGLVAFWNAHGQMILQASRNVWNAIKTVITNVAKVIQNIIQTMANVIEKIMKFLWPFIQGLVISTWNAIKGAIQGAIQVITGIIRLFSAMFTGNWSEMWAAVKQILSGSVQFVINFIQVSLVGRALRIGRSLLTGFVRIMSNLWNRVKSIFSTGINNALNVVKGFKDKFLQAGKNIVTSIANGIKGAIGKVTDAISGVTQKIRDFLPFSPAKEGALRDIMNIQIAESIADSIDKGRSAAVRAMSNLSSAIHGEIPNVDIASQINGIQARSQQQMSYDYANELTVNKEPARITLVLGNNEFEAFVDDINEVNAVNATFRRFD